MWDIARRKLWRHLFLVEVAIIDITNCDRPPRDRPSKASGEFEGHTGFERAVDRLQIDIADIGRHSGRGESHARGANHVAGPFEAETHRHLHTLFRRIGFRWGPARAQGGKEIADIIELVVGLLVLFGFIPRGYAFDRQLKILAIGIIDFGNAGAMIEHAAEIWRAWPVRQNAARGVSKRRGVDLVAASCVGWIRHNQASTCNDQRDSNAT